jgi:hypothetical protein
MADHPAVVADLVLAGFGRVQMDELTVGKVAEEFRGFDPVSGPVMRMTIGEGLLHCGFCDDLLRGGHHGSASWAPGTSADYDCANCGTVSTPAHRVDAQLQKLTQQRLGAHRFVLRWRENREAELDARIAEGHRIRAWCLDPGNHKQLARAIGRPLGIGSGRGEIAWGLSRLADQMVKQVEERAGLAGPAKNSTALLAELRRANAEYTVTYLDFPTRLPVLLEGTQEEATGTDPRGRWTHGARSALAKPRQPALGPARRDPLARRWSGAVARIGQGDGAGLRSRRPQWSNVGTSWCGSRWTRNIAWWSIPRRTFASWRTK